MPALFLILERNPQFWPRKPFPANRDRVHLPRQRAAVRVLRRQGPAAPAAGQLQAGQPDARRLRQGHRRAVRPRGLRRLLAELVATASRRGGFTAWEYYFDFGGGRPPWISGMAQATGIQAFGRASQLLGDTALPAPYAREALGAFSKPPPTGVRHAGPVRRPPLPPVLVRAAAVHHQRLPAVGDRPLRLREITGDPTAAAPVPRRRARGAPGAAGQRHRRLVHLLVPRPRVHPRVPRAAARARCRACADRDLRTECTASRAATSSPT